jgi:hypothetical protein
MVRLSPWGLLVGGFVLLVCLLVAWALRGIDTMWDSEWFTVSSRGNGLEMVADVRSYCNVIDWDVPYVVYVRRAGEADDDKDVVFSDRADCGYGPYVTWISPTTLKIKTWPVFFPPCEFNEGLPPTVFPPTIKRTRTRDITIVYAVYTVPGKKHRPVASAERRSLDSGRFAPDARDDKCPDATSSKRP